MKTRANAFVGVLLLCSAGVDASVIVQQPPRSFGYFIGDVIEQHIRLQKDGINLELTEIPPEQRVGQWLERLSSTPTISEQGQYWLALKYQIINAPSEPVSISLPALNLTLVNGEAIAVNPWPITISPLMPAVESGNAALPLIRSDRPPALPDARETARRLKYSSMALVATLLSWLAWWLWRQHTDASRLPFARALQDMRRLDFNQLDEDPQAWFALHHAFNDSAGRTINGGTIAELIQQQPWLKSLQPRIEAFYAASAARFFEQAAEPQPLALFEFSKALCLAEKQHSGGHRLPAAR